MSFDLSIVIKHAARGTVFREALALKAPTHNIQAALAEQIDAELVHYLNDQVYDG